MSFPYSSNLRTHTVNDVEAEAKSRLLRQKFSPMHTAPRLFIKKISPCADGNVYCVLMPVS